MPKNLRQRWLEVVKQYQWNPAEPGSEEYWCPELETCSRDKLKEIQSEKLEVLIRYVYETSPFYRAKFDQAGLRPQDLRSVDDLHKIPLTTKEEMALDTERNPPWGSYHCNDETFWRRQGWMMFTTSGTTAAPRAFRHTLHDKEIWAWCDARALWSQGVRPGDLFMIAFSYAPHTFLWGVHYACNLMGIPVIPASLDTRRRAFFMDRFKPTVLAATPSYLIYLGESMVEMGLNPAASSAVKLITGGEPGAAILATKRRIEELWGAELHEFIGCTEASPVAGGYTCLPEVRQKERPVRVHVMEDTQIWEVVDPETLEPLPDGQRGLAVVTNLFSESTPLLRFLMGDYTTFDVERCACGRTHKRAVGGFQGRADDMINVRGLKFFPSAVEEIVRSLPELGNEFEIVLTTDKGLDEVTVVAEAGPEVPPARYHILKGQLEAEMATRLELRFNVEIKAPGSLPRTEFKAKRTKDLRSRESRG
jgi:phenylacetate-CoA ligase